MALEEDKEKVVQELMQRIEEMEKQRQLELEEFKRVMEEQDRKRREEIDALKVRIEEIESNVPTEDEKEGLKKSLEIVKEKIEPVLENLDIFGDFRLRGVEADFNRPDGQPDRYRARIRFRLGAEYSFLDKQLAVGARLSTGTKNDPRSPYVSFGQLFEDFDIFLDRAYLRYSPSFFQGSSFIGGKFGLTLKNKAIYNELVWDYDVQPEGAAASYKTENIGPIDDISVTAGQYIVEENDSRISWLTTPQIVLSSSFAEVYKATLGAGGFLYYGHNLTPGGSTKLVSPPQNRGNATINNAEGEPVAFVSDFYILDTYLDLEYNGFAKPVILSGEFIHNFGAKIDQDSGFSVGAQLGKLNHAKDWRIYYQFQLIQQDAIFTPFSQDDFLLATNFWGHVTGFQYMILKNLDIHFWVLISTPDKIFGDFTDDTNFRGRVDLTISY